jgi:flagellar biosynthesis chaperone FliJ
MADLDPLIRLNKFGLEEKQRFLAKLYSDAERFEQMKAGMLDSVESEKDVTDADMGNITMIQAYLAYLGRVKREVSQIDNEIKRIEARIQVAIDDMRDAFGELKKIEITRDRRLKELAEENKKREDALFSEIALEIYRRSE